MPRTEILIVVEKFIDNVAFLLKRVVSSLAASSQPGGVGGLVYFVLVFTQTWPPHEVAYRIMDLASVLAELKVVDDFRQPDKNLATASFCQRACKVSKNGVFGEHVSFQNIRHFWRTCLHAHIVSGSLLCVTGEIMHSYIGIDCSFEARFLYIIVDCSSYFALVLK